MTYEGRAKDAGILKRELWNSYFSELSIWKRKYVEDRGVKFYHNE